MKWFGLILPVALIFSFYLMSEKEGHGLETLLERGNSSKDDSMEHLDALQLSDDLISDSYDRPSFEYQSNRLSNSNHSCLAGDCPDNEDKSIDSYGRRSWRMVAP